MDKAFDFKGLQVILNEINSNLCTTIKPKSDTLIVHTPESHFKFS